MLASAFHSLLSVTIPPMKKSYKNASFLLTIALLFNSSVRFLYRDMSPQSGKHKCGHASIVSHRHCTSADLHRAKTAKRQHGNCHNLPFLMGI